ncbi:MAG: Ig-like domain-containing protein [Chloroflexi bacterium]|nr:Ig-like domain-containing protein [Chloroflexota bacterium]MCY3583892.1 Ig-like domain-containing protein [Chloroflexota bacterium]MCY3717626.1 Ig-like domain-containing protein [Chloroflexota bacterium]MDE2651249.1 Ig-like domain-containing protein [Chloroflexota bacterium]MXX49765.1 SH3 domain-containing protein [Chloroflexota bacterium]
MPAARCQVVLYLACLLLAACNLSPRSPASDAANATDSARQPPSIEIGSPADGDEFLLGEQILVSVLAADSIGINQVKLFVDDQIVRTVSSESLQGELAMTAILDFLPQRANLGRITLRVLAYRGAVVSRPDEVSVIVRESPAQILATPALPAGVPYIPNDGICRALVNVNLNFRSGPGTTYRVLSVLGTGTLAPIRGRDSQHSWWQLTVEGRDGWVSGDFTTEYGDCSRVPVVAG